MSHTQRAKRTVSAWVGRSYDDLLAELRAMHGTSADVDVEVAHSRADDILLAIAVKALIEDYGGDADELIEAYAEVEKWYA